MEKEKESLKDSTVSVCKNLHFHSNEEENPQSFEPNVEQELPTTSENFRCNKDKIQEVEIGEISVTDLTPLELNSKLEGSLDFDEDLDDALSLATSCFARVAVERERQITAHVVYIKFGPFVITKTEKVRKEDIEDEEGRKEERENRKIKGWHKTATSPNDERFEDSVIDIDTKDQPQISKELQQTKMESTNPSQSKDLKQFKIPKLSNLADSSSAIISNEPELEAVNSCNTSPLKSAAEF
ncbi:hypothetical protein EVAR_73730_1 [Eumeta japonica]|uniref:Uncharacterized protein n=1 Tax=Eumeta variegata TaxID=151549 RepID=A0A4C1TST1_EUMVA|nr:hypothetical protein EVAR_73730_1 [Eumeta japonica]